MAVQINGTTGITTPKLDALDLELGSKNVVERGSNANGEYVRFADGTQICTKSSLSTVGGPTTAIGSIYRDGGDHLDIPRCIRCRSARVVRRKPIKHAVGQPQFRRY